MAALDLDRLSGGRFTLGLGSSVRAWNVDRFGVDYDRPVARLRELVGLVQADGDARRAAARSAASRASSGTSTSPGSACPARSGRRCRSRVAPLRAAMTEMAAEVADGILGHPVWSPRWIAGEHARGRRARPGPRRTRAAATCGSRRGCASPSPTTSSRAATTPRSGIPFYASLRQYDSYFEALGLAADARRLQDLAEAGAPAAEQAAAVSDAMADELVIIGPPHDVAARIAAVLDVVDDVCITPPNGLPAGARRVRYDDGHRRPPAARRRRAMSRRRRRCRPSAPATSSLYVESTGAGHPIVFVHEFASDHREWEPQVRWFSRVVPLHHVQRPRLPAVGRARRTPSSTAGSSPSPTCSPCSTGSTSPSPTSSG